MGVAEDKDEAEKVKAEVATRARGRVGRCGLLMFFFFARSNTTIKKHIQAYDNTVYLPRWT